MTAGEQAASRHRGTTWLSLVWVLAAVLVSAAVMVYAGRTAGGQHLATGGDRALAVEAGASSSGPVPFPPTHPPRRGAYVLSSVGGTGKVRVRTWITTGTPIRELTLSC